MVRNRKPVSLLIVAILSSALFFIVKPQLGRDLQPGDTQQPKDVDTRKFPVVDYDNPLPTDPNLRAKREAKSRRYNNRYGAPITSSTDKIFYSSDWDVGLPALPVKESSHVIIGEVIDAKAYLSEDKTRIYSEFVVRVDSILKNNAVISLTGNSPVVVERLGGRVRFPSGKVISYWVNHQDMPCVGGRYLLFLTNNSPVAGAYDDSLFILTGYELDAGKAFPLDKTSPEHPITKYKGVNETTLLQNLATALAMP